MWAKVVWAFALCLGCISIISESDLLSYKNRGKLEARICFKLSLPAANNRTAEFQMHTLPSSEFADTKNSLFADEHKSQLDAAARLVVLQSRVGNMQINSSFCATAHWSRALRFGRSQKCQRGRPAASLSRVSPVRRCLRRAAFRRSGSGGVRPRRPACWRVPLRSARADSGDFQGSKLSSQVVHRMCAVSTRPTEASLSQPDGRQHLKQPITALASWAECCRVWGDQCCWGTKMVTAQINVSYLKWLHLMILFELMVLFGCYQDSLIDCKAK